MEFKPNDIDLSLIDLALREDLRAPFCDATTDALITDKAQRTVKMISKDKNEIVICGIPLIKFILEKFDQPFEIQSEHQDGEILKPGDTLLTITANSNVLLMAERTLLNFVRHLSAVATLTQQFVTSAKNVKILDTRKTTPGMRHLEKYAVQCGGGCNHRMGLYDAIMIKDTHIDMIGGLQLTLEKLPKENTLPVIVEIRNTDELNIALHYHEKITRVLLDNMTIKQTKEAVALCKGKVETESSGNINLNTIADIATTGVDYASVGMLTYAASQVDLSIVADL